MALFGHPHLSITKKRLESFLQTFKEQSPDTVIDIYFPEHQQPAKEETLAALDKANKPDVIFCMGDLILIGVMYALHERKMKVPDDISVISVSNGFIPTQYDPKITHVETSGYKLGKKAFTQMMASLQGNETAEEVFIESLLIEGGSL